MVSRVVGIGLVVTLALALVGGSAYILLRPAEAAEQHSSTGLSRGQGQDQEQGQGQGQGQGRIDAPLSNDSIALNGNGNGAGNSGRTDQDQGQGQGQGRGQSAAGGGIGGSANENENELGNAVPIPHQEEADHPSETWETFSGTALSLDHELILDTDAGEVTVHLAPEWYWEAQGIPLSPGDRVSVQGFYESAEGVDETSFEVGRVENLTTGQAVTLRDDAGHPLWSGRGRRGG